MNKNQQHLEFWRGFGSALTIQRVHASTITFKFRGRDILTLTPEQAIRQDWSAFGKDFQCSVRKIAEYEQPTSSTGELVSR